MEQKPRLSLCFPTDRPRANSSHSSDGPVSLRAGRKAPEDEAPPSSAFRIPGDTYSSWFLPADHAPHHAHSDLSLRRLRPSDISAGAVVCGVTILRQVLMDRSGVYLFGRHLRCFRSLFGTHTNPGSTGGMQASRGSICIFANEPAASWLLLIRLHHVENYGRIFGGWLIGIDPSLKRIRLGCSVRRPSWPLRSLQRGGHHEL